MNTTFKHTVLASLTTALVLGLASIAFAAPIRNSIERRQSPGRGFWQNDRPVAAYRMPAAQQPAGETRQSFSLEGVTFQVGDMAQVAAESASLKIKTDVLADVHNGEEFKVLEVQGPWVGAEIQVNGAPVRGWIHHSQLRPAGD